MRLRLHYDAALTTNTNFMTHSLDYFDSASGPYSTKLTTTERKSSAHENRFTCPILRAVTKYHLNRF